MPRASSSSSVRCISAGVHGAASLATAFRAPEHVTGRRSHRHRRSSSTAPPAVPPCARATLAHDEQTDLRPAARPRPARLEQRRAPRPTSRSARRGRCARRGRRRRARSSTVDRPVGGPPHERLVEGEHRGPQPRRGSRKIRAGVPRPDDRRVFGVARLLLGDRGDEIAEVGPVGERLERARRDPGGVHEQPERSDPSGRRRGRSR